jgi:hypothetical protein
VEALNAPGGGAEVRIRFVVAAERSPATAPQRRTSVSG